MGVSGLLEGLGTLLSRVSWGLIGASGSLWWPWKRNGVMKLEELMSDDIIGVSQLYTIEVRIIVFFLSSDP